MSNLMTACIGTTILDIKTDYMITDHIENRTTQLRKVNFNK